jgi:hypothetical protein
MSLELHILTSLRALPSHLMMPVETLWGEVRMKMAQRPSRADFDHALRVLEDDLKQIVVIVGRDQTRAKITDHGIARLHEANS